MSPAVELAALLVWASIAPAAAFVYSKVADREQRRVLAKREIRDDG